MRDIMEKDVGKRFLVTGKRTHHLYRDGDYPVWEAIILEITPCGEFFKERTGNGIEMWDHTKFISIVKELSEDSIIKH